MLSSLLKINRKFNLCLSVLSLAVFSNTAKATDFETVYQSAMKNSTELTKIRANADEARANMKASNSNFMPRAGVESRYETFDSDFEKRQGGTANAFVEWNLFNGFKDVQNRKSLSADSQAAKLEQERFEMNFRWLVMAKYSKAQAMQEKVEAYKKVIQANLRNLEAVKLRRSSGRLSEADYLEFELFDSKLKQDLIELETEASASLAELEAFSGTGSLKNLTTQLKPQPIDTAALNMPQQVASTKSSLYASQLKVESAQAKKSLATGGFLPEVSLRATHGSIGLRETEVAPETAFGVTARWELFSGLETLNERRVAAAQLAKAKADFANAKIYSLSRAEQLKQKLESILTRFDFEEKNQKNVERFLKTVQEEYRRGVKNSADLKSALELALETNMNRAMLRSDYFEARTELQELLGQELKEKNK